MDFIDQYLDRARDIIGDRSADEKKYDAEVLKAYIPHISGSIAPICNSLTFQSLSAS